MREVFIIKLMMIHVSIPSSRFPIQQSRLESLSAFSGPRVLCLTEVKRCRDG